MFFGQALRLHPDKNKDPKADEAFKRVSAAFACLRDRRQRAMYDLQGGDTGRNHVPGSSRSGSDNGGSGTGSSRYGRSGAFGGDVDAEELYQAFFGGGDGDGHESSEVVGRFGGTVGRTVALGSRLLSTFVKNPWTLVTLLSVLASFVSVVETMSELLDLSAWQAAWALPVVVLFVVAFIRAGKAR